MMTMENHDGALKFLVEASTGSALDDLARSRNKLRCTGEPDSDLRTRLQVFIDSRRAPKDRVWAR